MKFSHVSSPLACFDSVAKLSSFKAVSFFKAEYQGAYKTVLLIGQTTPQKCRFPTKGFP